jgi:hypothetical protein
VQLARVGIAVADRVFAGRGRGRREPTMRSR